MHNELYIIIQARMTSTRLPGKVMLRLCDTTVLEMMLRRLERFNAHIIIATTNDGSEAPIVALCERLHIKHFRGDTDNVLERYYEAAVHFGANDKSVIVRCTSDCPMIDADILSRAIAAHAAQSDAYVYVDITASYPRGMDAEVFSFSYLKQAQLEATSAYEREHVTPYIRSLDIEKIAIAQENDDSRFRLTLDTAEDYEVITQLYHLLGCRSDFDYETLQSVLYAHPQITALNAHVEQKTH